MLPSPEDLEYLLKDGLRGARYVVRYGTKRGERARLPPGAAQVARLTTSMLGAAERTVESVLLGEPQRSYGSSLAQDVTAAFTRTANAAQRRRIFVRLLYRLLAAVLRQMDVENRFISEQEIARSYDRLNARNPRALDVFATGAAVDGQDMARFWATAALALAASSPLREFEMPRQDGLRVRLLGRAPKPFCVLVVALTGAVLTTQVVIRADRSAERDDEAVGQIIDSAIAVVGARFDRMLAALRHPRGEAMLAREIAAVLPFLP